MKIESVALPGVATSPIEELPVINAEEIKSILFLGIKGSVRPDSEARHTVDTYA